MKECLVQIVERSSTLFERLDSEQFEPVDTQDQDRFTFRLDKWMQYVADGDPELFEKRLSCDGLKLDSIRPFLGGEVRLRNQEALPPWTQTLEAIIKNGAYVDSAVGGAPVPHPAFHQVLIPIVNTASNKLKETVPDFPDLFTSSALSDLHASLLLKLSGLCVRTFALEMNVARLLGQLRGDSPEDRYQNFLQTRLGHPEGMLAFFMDYPVLARLVAVAIDHWILTTTEFVSQLRADLPEIQELFADNQSAGKVQRIVDSMSDPHREGRTTKKITFESGLEVIYKPRNLTIDVAFHQMLQSINARNVMPQLKCFKVLNKHTHGWVEFLQSHDWKDDLERANFYKRAGMLLALFHWLGTNDCHLENLFFCGEHPVLIDMETLLLLNTGSKFPSESADDRAAQLLRHSVLNTGMLPLRIFGDSGRKGVDLSGLTGEESQPLPFLRPVWNSKGSDAMRISMEYVHVTPPTSRPRESATSERHHLDAIVDGFKKMYEFLLAQKDLISEDLFEGPIRHTVRSTHEYFLILQHSLEPAALRDGIDRSIALDLLWRSIFKKKIEVDSKVLVAEREALEQLDIPYFYAQPDQTALHIGARGARPMIEQFFPESGRESVLARIASMSAEDLEQQLKMIRSSLYTLSPATTHSFASVPANVDTIRRAQCIEEAIRIAEQLRSEAIYGKDGTMTWIGTEYHPATDQFELRPLSEGFYNGKCGVALFFAALERFAPSRGYDALAVSCLQTIRNHLSGKNARSFAHSIPIGGMSGIGSICYGLLRTGELLNRPELNADARKFGRFITNERIEKDRQQDVVAGNAGTLLCLLALHRDFPDDGFLPLAIACGNKMLRHMREGQVTLAGFSHGASGFAYALCRLYQITGNQKFRNAALEAVRYENSLFSVEARNWRDLRNTGSNEPQFMTSWCHGAPGIGLARIASLDAIDSPEIRSEIDTALNTTLSYGLDGSDDLCCGNFGRIDILFDASRRLDRPEFAASALNNASSVVVRAHQNATYRISVGGADPICNPGLMKGLSGIGYALLRLVDQARLLPSVLLLQ